ncbi:unnamed protein product [Paramecium sonneborni]|uniref:RING-type domain-containing protein n=1 Tax=Paramecium sonneborni TaxID=65129 RepID=A0A8S1PFD5_9CILI|nr:unnamed protein product [Paramecium sonneborni]
MAENQESRRKVSFFEKYFCCGNSQEVQEPNTTNKMYSTVNEYLKMNRKDPNLYVLQEFGGAYLDKSKKIKTTHQLNEIMINNVITERTQHSCPICFCYFNYILASNCCMNYICHICALEFKNPKCHFCQNEKCKYLDADSKEFKIYTDSQGMQLHAMLQMKRSTTTG